MPLQCYMLARLSGRPSARSQTKHRRGVTAAGLRDTSPSLLTEAATSCCTRRILAIGFAAKIRIANIRIAGQILAIRIAGRGS